MKAQAIARGRRTPVLLLGASSAIALVAVGLAVAEPAQGAAGAATYDPSFARLAKVSKISVTRHVRSGNAVRVKGKLSVRRRRAVRLQRRTRAGWETIARVMTSRRGRFRASWTPPHVGSYRLRVRFRGGRVGSAGKRLPRVYVYRRGNATWYGPGFYGNRTSCGQTLTPETIGVAHKTLPCGTRVRFRYRGRSAIAKVIDRGPFRAGFDWDLTSALREKLRFDSSGPVWSSR